MPKRARSTDTGWQPIEVVVGPQMPPAVSEVDFTPVPPKQDGPAPAKPQRAASKKED